jgi:hypothetical protein
MSYPGTRPVTEGNGGGRRHRFGVLALCSALLLSVGLLAPPLAGGAEAQTGSLTGTVVNTAGQPVANAFVTIQASNRSGTTNARGQYTFQNVPAGSQEIRVTSLGYRSVTQSVTIQAGQTATLDFTLSVSAVALDEVVVTGQAAGIARREIGTSIASVDVTALEAAPINSLSQLLAGPCTRRERDARRREVRAGEPHRAPRGRLRSASPTNRSSTWTGSESTTRAPAGSPPRRQVPRGRAWTTSTPPTSSGSRSSGALRPRRSTGPRPLPA